MMKVIITFTSFTFFYFFLLCGHPVKCNIYMKVIITYTFCCDNLWKSKFMVLEKPGKCREFFPTL